MKRIDKLTIAIVIVWVILLFTTWYYRPNTDGMFFKASNGEFIYKQK